MNAISLYRIARRLHLWRVPFAPRLIQALIFLLYNSSIPPGCAIGEGSRFSHGGIGIVLNRKARIGRNVMIGPNVCVGGSFDRTIPVIGDNVFIGPNVSIVGGAVIGDNVVVGANSVVRSRVPPNVIVAGAPARVVGSIPPGGLDAVRGTLRRASENGHDAWAETAGAEARPIA